MLHALLAAALLAVSVVFERNGSCVSESAFEARWWNPLGRTVVTGAAAEERLRLLLDWTVAGQAEAKRVITEAHSEYQHVHPRPLTLLLYGPSNHGKTLTMAAIGNALCNAPAAASPAAPAKPCNHLIVASNHNRPHEAQLAAHCEKHPNGVIMIDDINTAGRSLRGLIDRLVLREPVYRSSTSPAVQTTGMILVMTSDLGKTDGPPAIDEDGTSVYSERRRAQSWFAEKLTDEHRVFGRTTIVQFSALHETDFFEILEHWARRLACRTGAEVSFSEAAMRVMTEEWCEDNRDRNGANPTPKDLIEYLDEKAQQHFSRGRQVTTLFLEYSSAKRTLVLWARAADDEL
ncbi:hypothetical protein DIPPA_26150 [Diplonema papillatum]|nr:hypothetical protein DIPPA_34463 [Diplonema papillatum]KAJ9441961.1 hypothetical protein DIPPA_19803 [Diplonema papillatum]KAJ9446470.1 hypothetical protein DIPPA_26150 [Diplonema papillatum]